MGLLIIESTSCKREGCTNAKAENYDSKAKTDDGSCVIRGCTNPKGMNYDSDATDDDGTCVILGCTNPKAENYDPDATDDNGTCIIRGCTNPNAANYDPDATDDDGSCIIYGCTDPEATNYNPEATNDDGSCIYPNPYGEAVFWTDADYGVGYISVYVNSSYVGDITGYLSSGTPDCGDEGFVTIERDSGEYPFYANANDTFWEGSITISNGICSKMRLYMSEGVESIDMGSVENSLNSEIKIINEIKK